MNKFTVIAIAIILLGFGGLVAWSVASHTSNDLTNIDPTKIVEADDSMSGGIKEHIRGKEDSPVVVIEYADLQCPGCASLMPRMSKLHEQYGDRVAFIFRNYPLKDHYNARAAAAACESAGFQGYYWQMLEALYSNRASWMSLLGSERTAAFTEIFKQVAPEGDVEAFESGLGDERIEKKVNFDRDLGKKQNVDATPSVYVNGAKIDISAEGITWDEIVKKIKEEIDKELKANGLETGPRKGTEDKEEDKDTDEEKK